MDPVASASRAHRRRHIVVVVLALVLGALAMAMVPGAPARLSPGGFAVRNGSAETTSAVLAEEFGVGDADVVAIVRMPGREVGDPVFVRTLGQIATEVRAREGVAKVVTPVDPGGETLVSTERDAALVVVSLAGTEAGQQAAVPAVADALRHPEALVQVGGELAGQIEGQKIAEHDLVRAELTTLPIVALLLWVFFRGALAAMLPLGVGALAIGLTTVSLRGLTLVMPVSVFALNVVTFVGLGLSIDYSLFVVQRFREELDAGVDVPTAVRQTVATAGKTVTYSGIAVAVSLLSLAWIPIPLLRSIAIGGAIVVVMTLAAALVVLPAALSLLGNRLRTRKRRSRPEGSAGTWHRIAHAVMRRPGFVAVGLLAILIAVGAPALRMRTAVTDAATFPDDAEVHQVSVALHEHFPQLGNSSVDVHVQLAAEGAAARREELGQLEARLGEIAGVRAVVGPTAARQALALPPEADAGLRARASAVAAQPFVHDDAGHLRVVSDYAAGTPEADEMIDAIVAARGAGQTVSVAGAAAAAAEAHDAIEARLPWAVASVAFATFVILLLGFGAVPVALKAIAMNLLSLAASFGALVWIFQDGRLEGLLQYQSQGAIDPLLPLLVFAIVFGLSMDYELFLLSRIREDWEQTGQSRGSVARGVQHTAGLITSAALVMIVVMAGFATSQLLFLRELGIAMVIAVVVDATIVRALLVPATMALMGKYNWWAPRWFGKWWSGTRLGVREGVAGETLEATATGPVGAQKRPESTAPPIVGARVTRRRSRASGGPDAAA